MANKLIKDVPLIDTPDGTNTLPVSDGGTEALTISVDQIIGIHEGKVDPHPQYLTSEDIPDVTYTNAEATPTTIGGIPAGSTFDNKTMTEMWDALLYPYQTPTFSAFGFTQTSPVEVGTEITGTKTFTWTTTNSSNVQSNSISILDITGSSTLASGLANDGTEALDVGSIQKNTATSHTWRITGINTQSSTFNRDFIVAWQWRRFYGESISTSLTESDIEALRVSGLATGFAGTYSFAAGGYKYLCYPTSFGTATTFKDQSTNLDVPFESPAVVSVTNANGVTTNYNVHRSTNILGSSINIVVS